jgi:single-stranded-DNA-specific exonuclease
VVLGIISDLAYLQGDTRHLVQRGLPILREMNRLGLKFLADLADLNPRNITEDHISFVLAPRLNALGRLGDANSIVEFFTTTDTLRAQSLAYELEGLNANRRLMSEQVYRSALSQLDNDHSLEQFNVITLTHPSWPAGVIGIAAARLVEQFRKPVILFSSPPGQSARGSARSVEGINISSAIAMQAYLLEGYGGHPMAAGLSIQPDNIPEFRRRISQSIEKEMQANPPESTLTIDNYLSLNELTLDLITDIERLAPFGMGNPPVLLACRNLSLTGYSAVGKQGEHLLMTLEDDLGYSQQAIWWQGADKSIPDSTFDLAFTARASTYRGQRGIQLEWIDYRPAVKSSVQVSSYSPTIIVEDYRNEAEPLNILKRLRSNPDLRIWCETEDRTSLQARDRLTIVPCNHLVIWSSPAGQSILQQILRNASPKFVYLFANPTSMDQPEAFLRNLAGLCKFAIRQNDGIIYLPKIAAATNQRLETIIAGLQWLQTHGHIQIIDQEQDRVHVVKSIGTTANPDRAIAAELSALLDESKAFRNYYLRADKDRLIVADMSPVSKNRSSK